MDASDDRRDSLFPLLDLCDLRIDERLKLLFVQDLSRDILTLEKKDQHHVDKQVEKECDCKCVIDKFSRIFEFDKGEDEADEKTAYREECYEIFTSQTFSL